MYRCVMVCMALGQVVWTQTAAAHVITWNHAPGDRVVLTEPNLQNAVNLQGRFKREVIEEDKSYLTTKSKVDSYTRNTPWMPETILDNEKTSELPSITSSESIEQALPLYLTTEEPTEKPGRGARMASHDNWVKLPSPNRDNEEKDRLFIPPQASNDLLNSRMPRVNFVTQNKRLDASESRNERDSISPMFINRKDDLRSDFVYPGVDSRARNMKEVYPRQALYRPEDDRPRYYYDDRYYPEELYRSDPYYDPYDRRVDLIPYNPSSRIDRIDPSVHDSYLTRKPKRIIYYAHLPEVVRSPPSVDMRYKYSSDPYRRYDDEHVRTGRYDPRFRPRYPNSGLKKDERASRDLIGSGTKDKRTEDKVLVPPAPVKKEEVPKKVYNNINSHQYHLDSNEYRTEPLHNIYPDVVRSDQNFLRYDVPSFQAAIDDPYADRN